jgi:hypothetical protein
MPNTNFSSLRAARQSALDKLNAEIKKETQKQGAIDERYWKLTVDPKTKIGYAQLRFLPAAKGEDITWARIYSHGFKLSSAWYIENCPTTLARNCPVCKENNKLWNSGIDSDRNVARDRKRKLSFISNVLVLNDSAHPENNGKVFLFRYGAKIHEKILEMINPKFPDQKPNDPFDFWTGNDFKLKSQHKDGFQNYDKSEFSDAGPVEYGEGSDEAFEELWGKQYLLTPLTHEEQFKSFEDLEKRLHKVLTGEDRGTAEDAIKNENVTPDEIDEVIAATEAQAREPQPPVSKRRKSVGMPVAAAVGPVPIPESEESITEYFAGVLN